jgi:hypothetical protein
VAAIAKVMERGFRSSAVSKYQFTYGVQSMSDQLMVRNAESVIEDVAEVSLLREGRGLAFHSDTTLNNVQNNFARKQLDVNSTVTGKDALVGTLQITGIQANPDEAIVDQEFRGKDNKPLFTRHIHQWKKPGANPDERVITLESTYKGLLDVTINSTCVIDEKNANATTCDEVVKDSHGTVLGNIHSDPMPPPVGSKEVYQSRGTDANGQYLGTVQGVIDRREDGLFGSIILDVVHEDAEKH